MRGVASWRLCIALAGAVSLAAAVFAGPDAANAQGCSDKDQKRIEELQRRIQTYKDRLPAAEKGIGDAEVGVYEATIKQQAVNADPKSYDEDKTRAELAVLAAKDKVKSAIARRDRIQKNIAEFQAELDKLLTKPCPQPQTLPTIPKFNLPNFGGWFFGVSARGIDGSTDIRENLIATGATTFHTTTTRQTAAITGEIGYIMPINSTWFAGVAASVTGTNLEMLHIFPGGASLGTRMDWYAAIAAQGGVWVVPQIAVFGEVGAVAGPQTLEVNFAPAFATSEWIPGVLFGGGVKVRASQMPFLFTARYNRIVFDSIEGRPPGSAFTYSHATTLNTFRLGVEVQFAAGR